jgi:hypothetical protein
MTIPKQLRTRIERAVDSALNFKGMSAGSPKVMLEISDVQYLLKALDDDDEPTRIPCSKCGKLTTRDPIYDDLCYRCCRAENE